MGTGAPGRVRSSWKRNGKPAGRRSFWATWWRTALLEVGRGSRDFTLTIIELPLSEPRAWYLEPDKIIMSHELLTQPEVFRSYVQPVVELLV